MHHAVGFGRVGAPSRVVISAGRRNLFCLLDPCLYVLGHLAHQTCLARASDTAGEQQVIENSHGHNQRNGAGACHFEVDVSEAARIGFRRGEFDQTPDTVAQ